MIHGTSRCNCCGCICSFAKAIFRRRGTSPHTTMTGQFRSSVWDPLLIISQIICIQGLFYISLGVWIWITDFIVGNDVSLDQMFSYDQLQITDTYGRMIVGAFILNAFTGACCLWYVVKRTKLCLDYTATAHMFHLIICWYYNSTFPTRPSWWVIHLIDVTIMTVLGEFLCLHSEMKAIPLSMAVGPKADL